MGNHTCGPLVPYTLQSVDCSDDWITASMVGRICSSYYVQKIQGGFRGKSKASEGNRISLFIFPF